MLLGPGSLKSVGKPTSLNRQGTKSTLLVPSPLLVGEVIRWVAQNAQGTGDGLTSANAAPRTAINSLISGIVAMGRPGRIKMRNDLGVYSTGLQVDISSGFPGSSGKRILIEGSDADGNPARVVINGNRGAAPNVTNGGPILFGIRSGANNLTFKSITFNNVKNAFLIDSALSYNINFEDCDFINVYRAISNDWTNNYNNPGQSRVDGFKFTRCNFDYIAQAGIITRNSRRMEIDSCTFNGRNVNQIGNDPAGIVISPSFSGYDSASGTTFPSPNDSPDNISVKNSVFTGFLMAPNADFMQGDGMNVDDSDNGPITDIHIDGYVASMMGDAGLDTKGQSGYYKNGLCYNCNISVKCWADSGFTTTFENWHFVNAINHPGGSASNPKARQHLSLVYSNVTYNLNDCMINDWPDNTAMPVVNLSFPGVPAPGTPIVGSMTGCILRGSGSKTGQVVNVNGWERWNVSSGIPIFARDDTGSVTAGVTINFNPPLPVVGVGLTWRPGFEGGFIPESTPVNTVLADLNLAHDKTVGVGAFSIVNNPDGKFAVNGSTLVLAQTLSYSAKTQHTGSFRGVYGIVGTNPANNPDNPRTWQCHMGITVAGQPASYKDASTPIYILSPSDRAEITSFLSSASAAGVDMAGVTAPWRTAWNVFVKSLDDAGIYSIYDAINLNYGPGTALNLRGLKNGHHGIIRGTVNKTAKGMFQSDGSTGWVEWPTLMPSSLSNFLQNSSSWAVGIGEELQSTLPAFSMGSGTSISSLIPKATSTQANFRINNQSAAVSTAILPGPSLWTASRAASNSMTLKQNGVSRGSSAAASAVLTAGTARLFTNTSASPAAFSTHKAVLWGVGGALTAAQELAFSDAVKVYENMVANIPM